MEAVGSSETSVNLNAFRISYIHFFLRAGSIIGLLIYLEDVVHSSETSVNCQVTRRHDPPPSKLQIQISAYFLLVPCLLYSKNCGSSSETSVYLNHCHENCIYRFLLALCWFLNWLIYLPWRKRQYFPLIRQWRTRLYGVTSDMIIFHNQICKNLASNLLIASCLFFVWFLRYPDNGGNNSSETSLNFYQNAWLHISDESAVPSDRFENLISHTHCSITERNRSEARTVSRTGRVSPEGHLCSPEILL
jgi:hypothetical protein